MLKEERDKLILKEKVMQIFEKTVKTKSMHLFVYSAVLGQSLFKVLLSKQVRCSYISSKPVLPTYVVVHNIFSKRDLSSKLP